MTASDAIDAARLNLLLNELRLPAIKHLWPAFTERADKEGWPAARLLAALAEHEIAERGQRRIERHLAEARLPPAKVNVICEFLYSSCINNFGEHLLFLNSSFVTKFKCGWDDDL